MEHDREHDDHRREEGDVPGPAEQSDTGTVGNADERSSENREEGLERDRERARHPEDIGGEDSG